MFKISVLLADDHTILRKGLYSLLEDEEDIVVIGEAGDGHEAIKKVLKLKPGKYVFRVTNKSVPYDLGFYLRGAGLYDRITLPKVSGGGLSLGVTKDYAITLKPGEYNYSCPLNTTPDYKIIVEG
ncbi:MAG: hypothetical protein QM498_15305 [Desulfobacterium sp.]